MGAVLFNIESTNTSCDQVARSTGMAATEREVSLQGVGAAGVL